MTSLEWNQILSTVAADTADHHVLLALGTEASLDSHRSLREIFTELAIDPNQWQTVRNAYTTHCDVCWQTIRYSELIQHIESVHHTYLRLELPRLQTLLHRAINRELSSIAQPLHLALESFVSLKGEIEVHLMKEEQILFPMIRELERATGPVAFHCGSLRNPVGVMMIEHESAKNALRTIRDALIQLPPPQTLSLLVRGTVAGLKRLEVDLYQHIREEDDILFPRAIALEDERNS
jgi:regulator of cell morphogenesis and NO signaling